MQYLDFEQTILEIDSRLAQIESDGTRTAEEKKEEALRLKNKKGVSTSRMCKTLSLQFNLWGQVLIWLCFGSQSKETGPRDSGQDQLPRRSHRH